MANGWRYQRDIADMTAAAADARATASEAARMREMEWKNRFAAIDKAATDQMRSDHDEIARLRAAVDNGSIRLRVAAKCPAPGLSPATVATGLDYRARAELDPDARHDYFALRDGLKHQERKLAACQKMLDDVTAAGGNP